MILLALLACHPAKDADTGDTGDTGASVPRILTPGPLNPFPTAGLVGGDGHLDLPLDALPTADGGTPWAAERFTWREGFSPVQTSVARFDVPIDAATLPGEGAIGIGGSVRMFDLDTGVEIPLFAELDAWPDTALVEDRPLLVRPMHTLTPGHTVAVAVTDGVATTDGAPLSTEDWADRIASDDHLAALDAALGALGVAGIAYAWDFPVGDGTAPTRAVASAVTTPSGWMLDDVRTADDAELPPGVWKRATGTYTSDSWLVDDERFELDGDGVPAAQGTAEAALYVVIPDSAREAAPGTVPVLVFGHGILADPGDYLFEMDDPSNVLALADRLGVIVVATVWRGLTTDDLLHAVEVSGDFSRISEITDMLAQGVANNLALARLVREGGLLDDPMFEGRGDPTRVSWYGISLGSIEGMVTLANQDDLFDRATLHVGGSAWSTMLERSSNWPAFEQGVTRTVPDAYERQQLYALSQLLWDAVDPASYAADLAGRPYLWQESIGDEQVPNLTTELLLRSAGIPVGQPSVTAPLDLGSVALPASGPVVTQFDPMLPHPPPGNRPAEATGAHGTPRTWEGCLAQTVHYLETGEVAHYCGAGACTAENTGE